MRKIRGFTLIEVLLTTIILLVSIISSLSLFNSSLALTERDNIISSAEYEAQRQMEQICNNDYQTIKTAFTTNGARRETAFNLVSPGLTGRGAIYAEELPGATNELMRIKVVVSCRNRNRIIGEDTNFNGKLNGSEDTNGNGELDSPCEIETVIINR